MSREPGSWMGIQKLYVVVCTPATAAQVHFECDSCNLGTAKQIDESKKIKTSGRC